MIQYHFHPTGKPEAEKSVVGLYFAKKPPARTLVAVQLPPTYSLFSGLDIPRGREGLRDPRFVHAAGGFRCRLDQARTRITSRSR